MDVPSWARDGDWELGLDTQKRIAVRRGQTTTYAGDVLCADKSGYSGAATLQGRSQKDPDRYCRQMPSQARSGNKLTRHRVRGRVEWPRVPEPDLCEISQSSCTDDG